MLIKEMHVRVEQGLQKIASNQIRNIQPDSIDLEINQETFDLIEEVVNPKDRSLLSVQLRADILKNIVVRNHELPAYISNSTDPFYSENLVYTILPHNYYKLESDESKVSFACKGTLNKQKADHTTHYAVVAFPTPTGSGSFYATTLLRINENGVISILYEATYGFSSPEAKFMVVSAILEEVRRKGVKIYWEKYAGKYYKNSFIIIHPNSFTALLNNTQFPSSTLTRKVYVIEGGSEGVEGPVNTSIKTIYSPNRLVMDDIKYVLKSPFEKTTKKSPVSTMTDDLLMAYHNDKFIINGFRIDYYKLPRKVSLRDEVSHELNEEAQLMIIDRVISRLAAQVADNRYQLLKNEETR